MNDIMVLHTHTIASEHACNSLYETDFPKELIVNFSLEKSLPCILKWEGSV